MAPRMVEPHAFDDPAAAVRAEAASADVGFDCPGMTLPEPSVAEAQHAKVGGHQIECDLDSSH